MEKAFTYGLALNRQGIKPITSKRDRMKQYFEDMELARVLRILTHRKANSVCGDRDGFLVSKMKSRFVPQSLKRNGLMSSRRSLSIYSEKVCDDKPHL